MLRQFQVEQATAPNATLWVQPLGELPVAAKLHTADIDSTRVVSSVVAMPGMGGELPLPSLVPGMTYWLEFTADGATGYELLIMAGGTQPSPPLAARVLVDLSDPTLIDIDPIKTLLGGFGGLGLAKGERLEAFLRESIGAPLQSLPTRFVAVATDLNTGEPVLLNHGDTPRALRASSAVPGLYEPVHNGERMLGDGQIVSPLPIGAARQLGARVVIGVDVVYPPQNASLTSPLSVLFQTVTISTYRHLLREREQADLAIVPDIPPTADLALSDREWLIAAGEAAAQKVLPALRPALPVVQWTWVKS